MKNNLNENVRLWVVTNSFSTMHENSGLATDELLYELSRNTLLNSSL
jgi:hypothetical protein